MRSRPLLATAVVGLALVVVLVLALGLGSVWIPPAAVARALVADAWPGTSASAYPESWLRIVWDLRMPRVLMGGLVGMGLALSGTVYQSLLRNPLAEPYLLGVSSGAGVAAVVAISIGGALSSDSRTVPMAALAGALAASAVIVGLARSDGRMPIGNLILAGVALGAFLSSVTAFVLFRSQGTVSGLQALGWLMGSLSTATWGRVGTIAPYILVPALLVLPLTRVMNLLLLGEEQAEHLGVSVERAKLMLVALAAVLAAGSVAGAGIVGFVGLIVPHTGRLLLGPDHRHLLPMAAVLGGAFLIACDLLARTLFAPVEIPVGIVTALFGAPFFLVLLRRRRVLVGI